MNRPTFDIEKAYWQEDLMCIGIDEVGRGPVAGPIVAAAVVFEPHIDLISRAQMEDIVIRDSKKMTPRQRGLSAAWIKRNALYHSVSELSAGYIDENGIQNANYSVMNEVVNKITTRRTPQASMIILSDFVSGAKKLSSNTGSWKYIVKGDALSFSIACASILAKEHRDGIMVGLSASWPAYRWEKNKGYGTVEHMATIMRLGMTIHHRKSFLTRMA